VNEVAAAALAGFALSGVPSTLTALARGDDPLEGARAAGTILLPHEHRLVPLLLSATAVHAALSTGWAAVLAAALPRGRELRWSVPAGLAIAALDLGLIGRRLPAIRALAVAPQVADHLAYSTSVALVLRELR
jgi:hypothetical protein